MFGTNTDGTAGKNRSSALKLYGLMEGDSGGLTATPLAKNLNLATEPEIYSLLAEACLKPKIFKILYDTFQGDEVSIARLKQQANQSGVHPDLTEICAETFAKSIVFSRLGSFNGDALVIKKPDPTISVQSTNSIEETNEEAEDEDKVEELKDLNETNESDQISTTPPQAQSSARSIIQVKITIDSSLDTEKLEKQLALLRKYGAV